ncbi:MAG: hypothetical protein K2I44_10420 [Muribaculaceae bacterium]|nr:hypothetical protein [Muribaculaceae bacterium]
MDKPQFSYCNTIFTISWILTVPLLINICTGCNLFSFWVSWILFFLITIISIIRLVHGFRQKCYKFCWGLIGELLLGACVLGFFQLSFNDVIKTPVSHPVTPTVVDIAPPVVLDPDSVSMKKDAKDFVKEKTKSMK